ncbi:type II secretion system protein E [Rubritalea halochordaticola]|uniref:Type II secretion system protein E n=1 Tax=Rubritalea halochordaticola TaxID=714537 RepID=A0ABP9V4N8_9BACT
MAEVMEIDRQSRWLIEAVMAAGGTDEAQVSEVVLDAKKKGLSLIDAVLDAGVVGEEEFLREVSARLALPWHEGDLLGENVKELKAACGPALAIRHRVVPLELNKDQITLACYDPLALEARQILSRRLPYSIKWVMSERRKIRTTLGAIYGVGADTFEKLLEGRDVDFENMADKDEASVLDEDDSDEASVLRFVNQIIREGLLQKATDIHIEPQHDILRIRYRVDGHLMDVPVPERINALQSSVIARLKIMSRLDVAERRVPQDGRINLKLEGKSIDVRVATIPSVEGETVSLRLLNQERYSLDQLGMEDSVRKVIDEVLSLSNGVILATGPTGSGKSTSLYCFLDHLNKPETRTVTIEDPVENKLPGIVQIAVKPEVGLTFAKGLRSILRADPNIVMVGEIRDTETAEIAIRASLTGHLVFSTLHTNTAIGGISRLLDMDIEPFLVAASVRAFLAQRLVRKLCPKCKVPMENFGEEDKVALGIPLELDGQPCRAVGCGDCRQTGYSGRIAIYEICQVSDAIQDMITHGADENKILRQATKEGFEPMRTYGWRKVMKGVTSIEEVLSSTQTGLGARAVE